MLSKNTVIAGVILLACGFIWIRSHGYNLQRELVVEASPEQVFKHLSSREAIRNWMPKPEKLNETGITIDLTNPHIAASAENAYVQTKSECGLLGVSESTWMLKPDVSGQTKIILSYSHKMAYTPMSFLFGGGLESAADRAYGRALSAFKVYVESELKR